jgi:hypothetical protein
MIEVNRTSWDWLTRNRLESPGFQHLLDAASALILSVTIVEWVWKSQPTAGSIRELIVFIEVCYVLAAMLVWSAMWRYWKFYDSADTDAKQKWFLIMLVGFWYGAIAYYLFSVRRRVARVDRANS